MQLAMIGLGRMGASMVRRLLAKGHECVVYDVQPEAIAALQKDGATGAATLAELAAKTARPRAVWMMVPAAIVDGELEQLLSHLDPGDIVIDGGNSYYRDDIRRAAALRATLTATRRTLPSSTRAIQPSAISTPSTRTCPPSPAAAARHAIA